MSTSNTTTNTRHIKCYQSKEGYYRNGVIFDKDFLQICSEFVKTTWPNDKERPAHYFDSFACDKPGETTLVFPCTGARFSDAKDYSFDVIGNIDKFQRLFDLLKSENFARDMQFDCSDKTLNFSIINQDVLWKKGSR